MASDGDSIETSQGLSQARRNLLLAKMLLEKYGAIHSFHTEQLQKYPIACCNYSISGSVSIYAEQKKVVFDVKTKRYFYVKNARIKSRFKLSLMKLFYMFKYRKEIDLAVLNLKTWTRELLWPNTVISITIDDELVYGHPTSMQDDENE